MAPDQGIRAFLLAAACALNACASPTDPQAAPGRFPIGLYGVSDGARAEELKAAGFDQVLPLAPEGTGLKRIALGAGAGGNFPSHHEIRFMSYLSILQGAKGIFFPFTEAPIGKTLLDRPEDWDAVKRMARELKSLQKVFEKGRPIHLPFPADPDGVRARAWRWRGRDYVIVLNPEKDYSKKFPRELLDLRWRPLFERRRDPRDLLKPVKGSYYLRPQDVLVLESRFFRRS